MAEKKKLIRIEKHPDCPGSVYESSMDGNLYMAILANNQKKDSKGFEIRQRATQFTTCRELLCCAMRAMAHPGKPGTASSCANSEIKDFDFEKLRLLLATNVQDDKNVNTFKRRLFAGKRALNLLEEYAGWEKSVITTVVNKDTSDKRGCYWMLTGPGEWAKVPQLLSLATLILRMAIFSGSYNDEDLDTESLESMLGYLKNFTETGTTKSPHTTRESRLYYDLGHLKEVQPHILAILKNHKKLFFWDIKKDYPENGSEWNGYGGINSYVKCSTGSKTLTSKFKKIVLKK
jgi:hypothetical protein